MVEPDRQQSDTRTAWCRRRFPRRAVYDLDDAQGHASIRGRLGVAFDRFLVFGTGGLAWGNPSTSYALVGGAPFATNGGNATGWTVGGGVDYALSDSVFGRLEYRYTNLGTSGFLSAATNSAVGPDRLPISDFRTGIAYKFGGRLETIKF